MNIRGQVMLITILTISGTILGATTIAGLLMIYQIRQSTDAADSAKAIFAADAGLEEALYKLYKQEETCPSFMRIFGNGSKVTVTCLQKVDEPGATIRSTGTSRNITRSLQILLQ